MNNTFSFARFLRLFNKHTREQYKAYLMSAAVLAGVLVLTLGLITYSNDGSLPARVQLTTFGIFLLFSGTIFTSMVFLELGNQKKAIPALTLPVSHFERFIAGWIYSFVIFQLVFFILFFAIDILVLSLGNINPLVHNELLRMDPKDLETDVIYLGFMFLNSAALLGAIYFQKMHFIKTAFALFIFVAIVSVINAIMVHLLFGSNIHAGAPFKGIFIEENSHYFHLQPTDGGQAIFVALICTLVVVLWITAFFRLKEKQV